MVGCLIECCEIVTLNLLRAVSQESKPKFKTSMVPVFVEDFRLCYRIEKNHNKYMFAVKHSNILLFTLLATSFGHQTITRPSLHNI
jgi:hypothetical protein